MGLIALNYIFKDEFILAPWLIALSMLFDFMDGRSARMLKATSAFGAQFDTMSDFVAFGVVPAFLAYRISLKHIPIFGAIVAVIYVFAGCYRLVRFTLLPKDNNKKHAFLGLPIPAAAGLIASYVLVSLKTWNGITDNYSFMFVTLLLSILMVSKIEYFAVDKEGKHLTLYKIIGTIFFLSVVFTFRYSYYTFLVWMSLYLIFGIVRYIVINLINLRNKKR
jgi:CDP-diacylglycerol--serine O-phosphatidyltransferase